MSDWSFAVGGIVNYLGVVLAIGASTAAVVLIVQAIASGAGHGLTRPAHIYLAAAAGVCTALAARVGAVRLIAPLSELAAVSRILWWLDAVLVGLPAGLLGGLIAKPLVRFHEVETQPAGTPPPPKAAPPVGAPAGGAGPAAGRADPGSATESAESEEADGA